jgi:hypothetical protein
MSDDGDNNSYYQPALAAVEEYIIQTGTGTEEEDVDAAVLPVLNSIWACPMINKFSGFNDNEKSYAGWTCGWCCWCPM